jgi:phenylacetate-coenzyme A ligase PaaK-like adenylate-forming protein
MQLILENRYNYSEEFYKKSKDALETALDTAPLYKSWKAFDPGPESALDARYDALPELTKKEIREHFPQGLVPGYRNVEDGLAREEIEYTFTSGTTEEKVVNIWNQSWWDSSEAASWKLNAHTANLDYPQKEAKLASSLNVGISCEEDLPMEYRIVGRKLYLNEKISLIQWQPRHYARMAKELMLYQPVILEANPSLLARLAFWAWDNGIELYSPSVIIFTYEFPSQIHLAAIRKVFSSPFVSSYGSTEAGFVMEQCEAGLFHQNTKFCRIDFHPLKDRYGGPELGRILATTINNPWNSIIRFDLGDLIRLHPTGTCSCGRNEGLIAEAIEGRTSNVTFNTEGGLVTTRALDVLLAQIPEIRDYHLEQSSRTYYELQVMLTESSSGVLDRIRQTLVTLYGRDGRYEIRVLPNILPGPAGKFRRTQTNFTFDMKGLFV